MEINCCLRSPGQRLTPSPLLRRLWRYIYGKIALEMETESLFWLDLSPNWRFYTYLISLIIKWRGWDYEASVTVKTGTPLSPCPPSHSQTRCASPLVSQNLMTAVYAPLLLTGYFADFCMERVGCFVDVYVVRCTHSTSGRGNFLEHRILFHETSLKPSIHLLEELLSILFCSSLSARPQRRRGWIGLIAKCLFFLWDRLLNQNRHQRPSGGNNSFKTEVSWLLVSVSPHCHLTSTNSFLNVVGLQKSRWRLSQFQLLAHGLGDNSLPCKIGTSGFRWETGQLQENSLIPSIIPTETPWKRPIWIWNILFLPPILLLEIEQNKIPEKPMMALISQGLTNVLINS